MAIDNRFVIDRKKVRESKKTTDSYLDTIVFELLTDRHITVYELKSISSDLPSKFRNRSEYRVTEVLRRTLYLALAHAKTLFRLRTSSSNNLQKIFRINVSNPRTFQEQNSCEAWPSSGVSCGCTSVAFFRWTKFIVIQGASRYLRNRRAKDLPSISFKYSVLSAFITYGKRYYVTRMGVQWGRVGRVG